MLDPNPYEPPQTTDSTHVEAKPMPRVPWHSHYRRLVIECVAAGASLLGTASVIESVDHHIKHLANSGNLSSNGGDTVAVEMLRGAFSGACFGLIFGCGIVTIARWTSRNVPSLNTLRVFAAVPFPIAIFRGVGFWLNVYRIDDAVDLWIECARNERISHAYRVSVNEIDLFQRF